MLASNIPWQMLGCIALLFTYIVMSRKIQRLPGVPLGLFVCYFVLILIEKSIAGYSWAGEWQRYIGIWSDILLAWGIARVVFWIIMAIISRIKDENEVPPKITRDFVLFITFVVLFLLVLRVRSEVNLASLLTTSAVITVVIGLAVQATLNNFFSGLIIQAERPFSIGDWLDFEGKEGRVVGISWKSTQLLTREQVLIYIPNSVLASSTFSNFSRPTRAKIARIHIGLEYGVPFNQARQVIEQVVNQHPRVLKRPPVNIRLIEYGDFSITYEIRVWHQNYAAEPQLKADIYQQLWYALKRNNIRIPFPIRDVYHGHIEREYEQKQTMSIQAQAKEMMSRVPILSPLSDRELTELSQNIRVDLYGTGELVMQEGQKGDSMCIIRSGVCDAIKTRKNGRQELLSSMQQGDFFGEISLLTGEKRTATIKTTQDTSLIVINKEMFSGIILSNPQISEQIAQVVLLRQQNKGLAVGSAMEMVDPSKKLMATIKAFFGI